MKLICTQQTWFRLVTIKFGDTQKALYSSNLVYMPIFDSTSSSEKNGQYTKEHLFLKK